MYREVCADVSVLLLQEVELEDLQIAVCVLESFLSARVASLDPGFILGTDLIAAQ